MDTKICKKRGIIAFQIIIIKVTSYLYLTFHRNAEEGNEIHYEDGPEDWNIEELEKRTAECDHCGFRC